MTTSTTSQIRVHIRWMIRRDMVEVLAIEAGSFDVPWIEEDFIRHLKQRNCIGMVAEHDDRVVGFMIYEVLPQRINLINFAVAPAYRRCGVGSQLVAKLVTKLSLNRRRSIAILISERNLGGQLFFRSQGFRALGVVRQPFVASGDDGYLLEWRVTGPQNRIGRLVGMMNAE